MTDPSGPSVRSVLREPLVHFVLLAGVLFGASALLGSDDDVIEISRDAVEWRILQVEGQEGRRLDPEERVLVRERYIDEMVLVREAREMGLDADERIDDILVQKMLHVLSGDVIQPTDEELAAYYAINGERYATSATVTVDEVVVASGASLPTSVREGGEPGDAPAGTLVASRVMPRMTGDDLAQIFGDAAGEESFGAEEGTWTGPFPSPRGDHWLRVRSRAAATVPPLEVVREAARLDWIAEQEDRRLLARVAELRARYEVRVEDVEEGDGS